MSLDWSQLRTLDGARDSFEELCCQLAREESLQRGYHFASKGRPDGGVECYAKLPSQEEWCWQAKFFLTSPTPAQWRQLDESFLNALKTHPQMTRFIVCLPQNLADARIKGQRSAKDRWDERTRKWAAAAKRKRRNVSFKFWGETELFARLRRPENAGGCWYWFHRDLFDRSWFERKLEQALKNAEPRYSPELNVEVLAVRYLNALARDGAFFDRLVSFYTEIKDALRKAHVSVIRRLEGGLDEAVTDVVREICDVVEHQSPEPTTNMELDRLRELCEKGTGISDQCAKLIDKELDALSEEERKAGYNAARDRLRYEQTLFYQLRHQLNNLANYCTSDEAKLSNMKGLVLLGEAGVGKTHLFCDSAKHSLGKGVPAVLLLGQHFESGRNPLAQIVEQLDLNGRGEHFLQALNAAGEVARRPALLMVDALNEGQGCELWPKHLAGLLSMSEPYPYVRLAISIRTPFERIVLPNGQPPAGMLSATHEGFAGVEYKALGQFFSHYHLKLPSTPLLYPEFLNPLFLKTLCSGLERMGLREMPPGLHGITAVLNLTIDSLHQKLWRELNYPEQDNKVQAAVGKLVRAMVGEERMFLPFEEAERVVNSELPWRGHRQSLFNALLSEGLLIDDLAVDESGGTHRTVRLSYERFTDHLLVRELLSRYLDRSQPEASVSLDGELMRAIKKFASAGALIEALTVQLPEAIGRELLELNPDLPWELFATDAFLNSLLWRRPDTITDKTIELLNKVISRSRQRWDDLRVIILTLSTREDHPLNADFLHRNMIRLGLVERDSAWGRFLQGQYEYEEAGPVNRLIDWAWAKDDKSHVSDGTARLAAMTLGWFFISSDRRLRDRATKAMVWLLRGRPEVMAAVLRQFSQVNDPYVSQRLYAAAYGCALHSGQAEGLGDLAQTVYDLVFAKGQPPADVLLRDWARGVIEYAIHVGALTSGAVNTSLIQPPYGSSWPAYLPSREELEARAKGSKKDAPSWLRSVIYSVWGFSGDFGLYIIGTNSGYAEWFAQRLESAAHMTEQEQYEVYLSSLSTNQRERLEAYRVAWLRPRQHSWEKSDEENAAWARLQVTVSREQLGFIEEFARPFWVATKSRALPKQEHSAEFNLDLVQRFVVDRVMQLAGTEDFPGGELDHTHLGRSAPAVERVGKKYQWVAYHEALARLNDNFVFRSDRWSRDEERGKYVGPWQFIDCRDIDPSFCVQEPVTREQSSGQLSSWFSAGNPDLNAPCSDEEWVKREDNMPDVEDLAGVTTSTTGERWHRLHGFHDIAAKRLPADVDDRAPRRRIAYSVDSVIVGRQHATRLMKWLLCTKRDTPRGSYDVPEVLFGEFPWAPSYQHLTSQWPDPDGWESGPFGEIPVRILPVAAAYPAKYSQYDNSLAGSFECYLPCAKLVREMAVHHGNLDGRWYDSSKRLIFFDPGLPHREEPSLLAQPTALRDYLGAHDYDIIWIITGWKHLLGGGLGPKEDFAGDLRMLGVFRRHKEQWQGGIRFEYLAPDRSIKTRFRGDLIPTKADLARQQRALRTQARRAKALIKRLDLKATLKLMDDRTASTGDNDDAAIAPTEKEEEQ